MNTPTQPANLQQFPKLPPPEAGHIEQRNKGTGREIFLHLVVASFFLHYSRFIISPNGDRLLEESKFQ